jgi:hypothetical protein
MNDDIVKKPNFSLFVITPPNLNFLGLLDVLQEFSNNPCFKVLLDLIIFLTFFIITQKPKFEPETIESVVFRFLIKSHSSHMLCNIGHITSDNIENESIPNLLHLLWVLHVAKINFEFTTGFVHFVLPGRFDSCLEHLNSSHLIRHTFMISESIHNLLVKKGSPLTI